MTAAALPDLQSIAIQGRKFCWRETGNGDPVVLVHGIGGHSGSWRHQFGVLSGAFRVIAWDAPGYGNSDSLPPSGVTAEGYSQALAALLHAINVQGPHLVGHSLGSIMIAAACRADAVVPRSLTFLQPVTGSGALPADERENIRQARIADMRRLGPREFALQRGRAILSQHTGPEAAAEAMEVMKAVPEVGYLCAWDMMCRSDLYGLLQNRYPTMVICGSDDPVCPPQSAQSIAAKIDGASYHCLENVGHYASIEQPGRLNALLLEFFARIGGRAEGEAFERFDLQC
jgi:pimeloyl-ACP methyl ester carboxylesterase